MSASEYSFIDIAVLDDVRGRFAAGDALAILSSDLEEVIWANGPGAHMFGYPDIEAIMGAAAGLGLPQKRQIAASPGFPDIGTDRALLLRLAAGHTSRAVSLLASAVRLPDGERAILLAAPAAAAGARDPMEVAARAISGFTEAGYYAAYLRAGRIVACTPGYEELGIAATTVAAMVTDVADASDRLVKRRIAAASGRIPAGIARLSDEPAVHLLVVVDDPQLYRAADFPEEAPARTPDRASPGAVAEQETAAIESEAPSRQRHDPAAPRHDAPTAAQPPSAHTDDEAAPRPVVAPSAPEAPVDDGVQRHPIDRWYFEADAPAGSRKADEAPVAPAAVAPAAPAPDGGSPEARAMQAPEPAAEGAADDAHPTAAAETAGSSRPVESADLPFTRAAGPVRFAWRTNAEGRFSAMSRDFLAAVGADEAAVIGRSFADLAGELGIDPKGEIEGLLARRDTWSGKTVLWPLAGTGWRAPVDLAALPVYSRDRSFEGFRGFGIARLADSVFVPSAKPAPEGPVDARRQAPEEAAADAPPPDREGHLVVADRGRETGRREDASASADPASSPQEAAPGQEMGGSTVIPLDEARSRRFSDKIIRLAEHRPPAIERNLSPGERNAFREIGDRLKKVTEPREEGPDGARPKRLPQTPGKPAPDREAAAPRTSAGSGPAEEASLPSRPPAPAGEPVRPQAPARPERPEHPGSKEDGHTLPRAANPFFIEVEEELSEEPIAPDAQDAVSGRTGSAVVEEPLAEVPQETAARPEAATPAAGDPPRDRDATPPMAQQPPAALGSIERQHPPAADDGDAPAAGNRTGETPPAAQPLEASRAAESPVADGEQAEAEEAPAETGSVRSILTRLPLPMLVHAGDVLHFANRSFLDFTGYAALADLEQAGGLGALFAERSDDAEPSDAPAHATMLRRQDGSTLPVRAHLQSIAWERGKALLLALRPADGAQERVEERPASDLAGRVEEMRTILDTATDGVVVIAPDGTIRSINRPAEALFGYDDREVAGKPFVALLAVESQRAARDYLQGLSDNGVASVLNDGREVIGREAQGRFIPLFMTIGRLPGGNGFCAVLRDITSWKRAEEELTKARTLAERASSQKSEFLARVSHEIRTPLNAIIGFSELMMDEKFGPIGNERYRDYLRDINRSGNLVLDIVNDLLDISKIEAGEQEMAYEAVALNDVLAETVAMMQPQANRERVIIRSSFASRLPEVVADLRSVRQIGLNLLSNAVRFTQPGGQVIVSTAYEASGDVVMRVRDTGIGMSSAEIEQALKPFKQINSLKRTRNDGTGLGLPLTKAMVEANRARFTISSAPGEGTLVEICFPSTRVLAD
ncbi:PAS domain S-box protein [Aquibium microcysteis]|uniref:PAS domain S-box protein n=1 Tax=Aquibium microcysteis TaxID=675281 RepID=UPI00165D1C7D|nr:PAS domain S-box protein [Aquibium microcysteis]